MEVDWYLLEGDLKREVFSEMEKTLNDSRKNLEKTERISIEEKPQKLKEADLKKMKKADLIELLLEKDEELHIEMDATGTLAYEAAIEATNDLENAVLNIEENVVNCLKRTFRHMEDNG